MERKPTISLIAALGKDTRAIGRNNDLLWSIKDDLARFKHITTGHPVIMGRKTWESIPEKFRPLPGRTNIVVSRSGGPFEGAHSATSLPEALRLAAAAPGSDEVCVIGGGEIYRLALPFADRLYLTLVDDAAEGDAYFPNYTEFTNVIEEEKHEGAPSYTFLTLER